MNEAQKNWTSREGIFKSIPKKCFHLIKSLNRQVIDQNVFLIDRVKCCLLQIDEGLSENSQTDENWSENKIARKKNVFDEFLKSSDELIAQTQWITRSGEASKNG